MLTHDNQCLLFCSSLNKPRYSLSFSPVESLDSMGLLRFERKSMAPEATRIPSYPTGPKGVIQQKEKTDKRVFGERDRIKDL